ncbi:hypothetical protein [Candidatus Uabimicrobium amorphum]|nr:hypothetical protein [Candidatus Uabimicrobium amorphum]
MSILTILNTLVITFWLSKYHLVHYHVTQLRECTSNNPNVFTTTVHSFMSPKNIELQQKFTQLPMPLLVKHPQFLTRKDNSWFITITNTRHYVCQTFHVEEYIGSVAYDQSKFINDSEKDWLNLYFRDQDNNVFLGDCLSGNSVVLSQGKQAKQHDFPTLLLGDRVIYSLHKKNAQTMSHFAFFEEYEIHYINVD